MAGQVNLTSRRGFLGILASVAAGAVLDPERLLWVPGAKTIFLPTMAPVFTSGREVMLLSERGMNAFITPEWLSRETLRMLLEHQRSYNIMASRFVESQLS